ncbi:MAG: imidazole glycerol phosphate synthase subunit HisH [Rhodobacteraceae bacterium]|nr:imidazole glycerol phosphate synthase subunit HisH [Paracoccaceae bacterium]|tara:strand:- start:434 stop:1066 length:633 start_codon:yes stop_codon:yes gene_type:complete
MDVVIVDYGLGNLWSVKSAFEFMGANVNLSSDPAELVEAKTLVLPGVGSFGSGMKNLHERGLIDALNEAVLNKGTPILGICLGMQLLADTSEEAPGVQGLGWIPGHVSKFIDKTLRLPHVGFNGASAKVANPLFDIGSTVLEDFYFVHSYHFVPDDDAHILARTHYGDDFTSAVNKGDIFGVQFHPEKSQSSGLKLISRFIKLGLVGSDG